MIKDIAVTYTNYKNYFLAIKETFLLYLTQSINLSLHCLFSSKGVDVASVSVISIKNLTFYQEAKQYTLPVFNGDTATVYTADIKLTYTVQ